MHNLAQILVEKAKRPGISPDEARRHLNQATELLRSALRQDAPRLRRHIHSTRDRLEELRRTLPPRRRAADRDPRPARPPAPQGDPARAGRLVAAGPGGGGGPRPPRRRRRGRRARRASSPRQPEQKFLVKGTVSLGEMILAKLKEKEKG